MSEETLKQFNEIKGLLTELTTLSRVALLDDGVLRFNSYGKTVHLYVPDAHLEYVQRTIVRGRNFYEARQLGALRDLDVIKPGATILDVGANIGNHSVFFSKVLAASRVIACEPQDHAFATLERNMKLNGMTSSKALQTMVGKNAGKGRMAKFNPVNYGGAVFEASDDGDTDMTSVDALRDSYGKFDFIKIDVEGFEEDVLAGSVGTIQDDKPGIWIELLGGEDQAKEIIKRPLFKGYKSTMLSRTDFLLLQE